MRNFFPACIAVGLSLLAFPGRAEDLAASLNRLPVRLSEPDKVRLANFDQNRAAAIAAARQSPETPSDLAELNAVLQGSELPVRQKDLVGQWRCRTFKLGGGLGQLTMYPYFKCRIFLDGKALIFQKTTGSQRTRGTLYSLTKSRFVYVGASTVNDDPPIAYGADPNEDQVAYLFRVGSARLRLEFPKPYYESDFDIFDLRK